MWADSWDGGTWLASLVHPCTLNARNQVGALLVAAAATAISRVTQHAVRNPTVPFGRHGDPIWLPPNNKECKRVKLITAACCMAFYGQCAAGWAAGTDHCSPTAARHVKEAELNGVGISVWLNATSSLVSLKHLHPEFGYDRHASLLHLCTRHVSLLVGIGTAHGFQALHPPSLVLRSSWSKLLSY
jgi:hypothetical protein